MAMKLFKIICPMCGDEGDIMSCTKRENNLVQLIYICPYCGHSDKETHYLYNDR